MTFKRVDTNHGEIVGYLRKIGFSVVSCAALGDGFPDLAIGYGGLTMLGEVKTETGKLTKKQEKFFNTWTGGVRLLRNEDDCLRLRDLFLDWSRLLHEAVEREKLRG